MSIKEYPNSVCLNNYLYEKKEYNIIRRCKILLFSNCLGSYESICAINNKKFTKTECENYKRNKSIEIEKGCLNKSLKLAKKNNIRCIWENNLFVDIYHNICYKVAINIDPKSCINSQYLRKQIINNKIDAYNIASMTSKEMCPNRYKKIDSDLEKRNNIEVSVKCSKMYKCRKCKTNNTQSVSKQNRSLDECNNFFVTCMTCGHAWWA